MRVMEESRRKMIAGNIKEQRLKRKLTQKEVADGMGKHIRRIQQWENGEFVPSLDVVIDMADFYNITIDELINGK